MLDRPWLFVTNGLAITYAICYIGYRLLRLCIAAIAVTTRANILAVYYIDDLFHNLSMTKAVC